MKEYYRDDDVTLYHGDGAVAVHDGGLVITDPPYNIGFDYGDDGYADQLSPAEYATLIAQACRPPSVVIHYAESMFAIADAIAARAAT